MILEGVTDGGAIVPVRVTQTGRLVAEGLQGAAGPAGPQGPQGATGPQGPAGAAGAEWLPNSGYWARQSWTTRSSAADNELRTESWAEKLWG